MAACKSDEERSASGVAGPQCRPRQGLKAVARRAFSGVGRDPAAQTPCGAMAVGWQALLPVALLVLAIGCGTPDDAGLTTPVPTSPSTADPTETTAPAAPSTTSEPTTAPPTTAPPTTAPPTTAPPTTAPPTTAPPTTAPPTTAPPTTAPPTTAPPTTAPPTTAPPTTVPPTPVVLGRGDEGPEIRVLQERLTALRFWLGAPDGAFGHLTEQAVYAFQKANGITVDGRVGPETRAALADPIAPVPRTRAGRATEIDKARQLLYSVVDGRIDWVFNTSTGTELPYDHPHGYTALADTPPGTHTVFWETDGWEDGNLGPSTGRSTSTRTGSRSTATAAFRPSPSPTAALASALRPWTSSGIPGSCPWGRRCSSTARRPRSDPPCPPIRPRVRWSRLGRPGSRPPLP